VMSENHRSRSKLTLQVSAWLGHDMLQASCTGHAQFKNTLRHGCPWPKALGFSRSLHSI
jgi:hypothetical protein